MKKKIFMIDSELSLLNVSKIRSQFLVYKLKLFSAKRYLNFVRTDHVLRDSRNKYSDKQTNRQTSHYRTATKSEKKSLKKSFKNLNQFLK